MPETNTQRLRLPEYLKTGIAPLDNKENKKVKEILTKYALNTVCDGARCPNKALCFGNLTATFLIMGKKCTRNCKFCNIKNGFPEKLNPKEPENIAKAICELNLKYCVITSVTRDDIEDGGAYHFKKTIEEIRKNACDTKIEVLTPDFKGNFESIKTVLDAAPDVFNHNVETVERLSRQVRPMANYQRSLDVLAFIKQENPKMITKTGIMTGLGETADELLQTFREIKKAQADILTIGQYIQPSGGHFPVQKFYTQEEFDTLRVEARKMGIKAVVSGPLVRSSYKAYETYQYLTVQK